MNIFHFFLLALSHLVLIFFICVRMTFKPPPNQTPNRRELFRKYFDIRSRMLDVGADDPGVENEYLE